MSKKHDLRIQRGGTVINLTSKNQEKALTRALQAVENNIREKFKGVRLDHQAHWLLTDIVEGLSRRHPDVDFHHHFKTSSMRPDGGILSILDKKGNRYPILISEKKNQGTNDLRALEGKSKQAKGNAIERLGKNVIGFRTAMLHEAIFPFVCFGDGCDFDDDSSILDRVVTIAEFGHLNKMYVHNQGPQGLFDRGSFYFRVKEWSESEMMELCTKIATASVFYYYSKYGEGAFTSPAP